MSDTLEVAVARLETKQEETERQLDKLCQTQDKILDKIGAIETKLAQVSNSVTNYNKWLWIVASVVTTAIVTAILGAIFKLF